MMRLKAQVVGCLAGFPDGVDLSNLRKRYRTMWGPLRGNTTGVQDDRHRVFHDLPHHRKVVGYAKPLRSLTHLLKQWGDVLIVEERHNHGNGKVVWVKGRVTLAMILAAVKRVQP